MSDIIDGNCGYASAVAVAVTLLLLLLLLALSLALALPFNNLLQICPLVASSMIGCLSDEMSEIVK